MDCVQVSTVAEGSLSAGVDTATDPRAPALKYTVEPEEIQSKTGLAFLHSSHCLGSGGTHGPHSSARLFASCQTDSKP